MAQQAANQAGGHILGTVRGGHGKQLWEDMNKANLAALRLLAGITGRLVSVPHHLEGTSSLEQLT